MSKGVKKSVLINPPMITVASGRWTSEPMPLDIAAGIKPKIAKKSIDKIALNCSWEVILIKSNVISRPIIALLRAETRMTPAITEIPKIETKPTPAETLK